MIPTVCLEVFKFLLKGIDKLLGRSKSKQEIDQALEKINSARN